MKKVITPVGTSLLMNYKDENKNMIEADLRTLQDHNRQDKPAREWENCSSAIKKIKEKMTPWTEKKLKAANFTASAEITSLVNILKEVNEDLEVYLLATETVISRLASEIIAAALNNFKNEQGQTITITFTPAHDVIRGLQVKDQKRFEKEGMIELIRRIEQITGGYYENVALDVTGGYKATIPYLTLMGQLKNVPLYYTFDEPPYELITIPQAPIDMNWGMFEKHSHIFEQLSAGVEQTWESFKRQHMLQDDFSICIYEDTIDHRPLIGLNAFGEMFWNQFQYFFVTNIPMGSEYFREEANRKRELRKAFQVLYRRLTTITEPLETLTDSDLKHTIIEDSFVYKHSSPQIRIQYRFEHRNRLIVYNYMFITSAQDDRTYSEKMRREYAELKRDNVATLTLKKEV